MDSSARLRAEFRDQRGVASAHQLDAAGISAKRRRTAVAAGYLERVGVRSYRSAIAAHSVEDDLAALVHDLGPNAWASGPSAAALHGFDGFVLRRPFHITVLRGRNVRRPGVTVHTAGELPLIDRARVRGVAVTSGPRTVIDLGASCAVAELTVAIDSMIRDGRGSEDLLHRRVLALRGSGRRGVRNVIAALDGADARRGGHSYLERRFLRLVAAAGLPRPATQVDLGHDRVVRVDCHWPGTPLVVELLGHRCTARQPRWLLTGGV